ncbi:copper chaperone PCu(A)C [Marinicellulosiphila megalodicopiae]|uniref:copper chaperone PCu(A)C n=1 Tax=Marinicellulosiphila megalodicopiae TaxID=2724896 RepID=UPI003BB169B0
MKNFSLIITLMLSIFLIHSCSKQPYVIENAVMRLPAGAGTNSAVFFTFKNQSDQDIQILSASSPLNAKLEIHNVSMKNNMMHMHPVDNIKIKSNSEQQFKSGSFHIMVMGIKDSLIENDKVLITLTLDNNQTTTFEATVQNMTSTHSMKH